MQLEKRCPDCRGHGYIYEGRGANDPEANRVFCGHCNSTGLVEITPLDLDGRRVRIPSLGCEGECHCLFEQLIVIDDQNVEHFLSIGDLELCDAL